MPGDQRTICMQRYCKSQSRQWQQSGFITILDKNNKVVSNFAGNEPQYINGRLDEMYQTIKVFNTRMMYV